MIDVPEGSVGQSISCTRCNGEIHFVAAELLAAGSGSADFDAKLIVIEGPDRVGHQILLGGVVDITIGKSAERQIRLGGGTRVSRAHAKLVRVDFGPSRWRIEDTKSTNGLWINDRRVRSQELHEADIIRIGEYALRFVSTYSLPAPAPVAGHVPAGSIKCPGCANPLPPGTKICIECGIDLKTGRPLVVSRGLDEDELAIRTDTWIRIVSWFIPVGLLPIASEAFGTRRPITTWVITAVTALVSTIFLIGILASDEDDTSLGLLNLMHWVGDPNALDAEYEYEEGIGFRWWQLATHALLHDPSPIGFIFHLGGNLLFLWVFGMRVNEVLGNAKFAVVYPLLAIGSALIDLTVNADKPMYPTLGASGAIMGLAGMYLVFFPVQRVHMAMWARWWLIFFPAIFSVGLRCDYKAFALRGFWLLVLWILWNDVLPVALGGDDQISHWAHLGGFVTGVALALMMLITRQADALRGDLLSVVLGRRAWALLGKPSTKPATG